MSEQFKQALWELIWAGWITGDTFAPVRAMLCGHRRSTGRRGAPAHRQRQRPPRLSRYSVAHAQARSSDPTVAGRWSALPAAEPESTVRAHFQAELLLNRYGVLTKGAVGAEEVPGGFAMLYKVLTAFEDAGRCQRGLLRRVAGRRPVRRGVDRGPAAVLPRRCRPGPPRVSRGRARRGRSRQPVRRGPAVARRRRPTSTAHRPGRKAGALVAVVDGELAWFLERGGRSLLSFTDDAEAHRGGAAALADLVGAGRVVVPGGEGQRRAGAGTGRRRGARRRAGRADRRRVRPHTARPAAALTRASDRSDHTQIPLPIWAGEAVDLITELDSASALVARIAPAGRARNHHDGEQRPSAACSAMT